MRRFHWALARILLPAAVLVIAAAVQAASLVPGNYTCPVDGTPVEAMVPVATNALGGTDSDFCQYAKGSQARENEVITCPSCYYTARLGRFDQPLTDIQREKLLAMLATATDGFPEVERLEPWDRYQLAVLCAGVLDESALERARLLHTAAWTARDRIVGFLPGIDGPLDVRMKLDELDEQWLAIPDLLTQQRGLFLLVQLAHRGGFTVRRDAYLAQLDDLQPVPAELTELRAQTRELITVEDRFLGKAILHYEAALRADEGTPEDKLQVRYLIVDLRRRLGETEGLREEINLLATDANVPENLRPAIKSVKECLTE
jgi:hypothetical protein